MRKRMQLNRKQYKKIKVMDHKQMEDFICNVYNEGHTEGRKDAEPRIKASDIASALITVKGVDAKKATEIMAVVNDLYEKEALTANNESAEEG